MVSFKNEDSFGTFDEARRRARLGGFCLFAFGSFIVGGKNFG
jgi:hypothetical protein